MLIKKYRADPNLSFQKVHTLKSTILVKQEQLLPSWHIYHITGFMLLFMCPVNSEINIIQHRRRYGDTLLLLGWHILQSVHCWWNLSFLAPRGAGAGFFTVRWFS